jgi:hypothetical protein
MFNPSSAIRKMPTYANWKTWKWLIVSGAITTPATSRP